MTVTVDWWWAALLVGAVLLLGVAVFVDERHDRARLERVWDAIDQVERRLTGVANQANGRIDGHARHLAALDDLLERLADALNPETADNTDTDVLPAQQAGLPPVPGPPTAPAPEVVAADAQQHLRRAGGRHRTPDQR